MRTDGRVFVAVGMAFFWCVALPRAAAAQTTAAKPSVNRNPVPDAMRIIQHAPSFTVGSGGLFFALSREETALRVVLRHKDARACLRGLLKTATPAGKLYALLGLRRALSPAGFEACAAPFHMSRGRVKTVSGCIGDTELVCTVAARIARGDYAEAVYYDPTNHKPCHVPDYYGKSHASTGDAPQNQNRVPNPPLPLTAFWVIAPARIWRRARRA